MRTRRRQLRWRGPIAVLLLAAGQSAATGATSSTVVTATVPSATALSTLGCPPVATGSTNLGVVLPGSSAMATADCAITFGSSNDVARLLVGQSDASGRAMWAPPRDATLDPTFGVGGARVNNFYNGNDADVAQARPLADGGMVVVGTGFGNDRSVARYDAAGAVQWTSLTDRCGFHWEGATSVAAFSNGRIVTLGGCVNSTNQVLEFERLLPTGVPDTAFGPNGRFQLDPDPGAQEFALALAADPGDRLVIAGHARSGTRSLLARRAYDGSADATWTPGWLELDLGTTEQFNDVLVDRSGRIVAAGVANVGGVDRLTVVRRLPDGAVDPAFNGGAAFTLAVGGAATSGRRVVELADGDLLVAASFAGATATDVALVRLSPSGSPRGSFGTAGVRTLDVGFGADAPVAAWELPDGRISVAMDGRGPTSRDFVLARVEADGGNDTSITGGGPLIRYDHAAGGSNDDVPVGAGPGTNGAAWFAGHVATSGLTPDAAVVQLRGGSVADFASGTSDWSAGTSAFGACLHTLGAGATGTWPVAGTGGCTVAAGANWRPIASVPTQVAAATGSGATSIPVALRFGMRAASDQLPGRYVAGVAFTVVAP